MIEAAGERQIDAFLSSHPDWKQQNGKLHRTFEFADFAQAFAFMTRVAQVAEQLDHHPDWRNVYKRVEVTLFTHEIGALSARDFALAQKMDKLAAESTD